MTFLWNGHFTLNLLSMSRIILKNNLVIDKPKNVGVDKPENLVIDKTKILENLKTLPGCAN